MMIRNNFGIKKAVIGLSMLLSVTALPGYAALDLELTQGVDAKLPIALQVMQDRQVAGDVPFSQIINRDLTNSGQFAVKLWDAHMPAMTDFTYWRQQKIDDVALVRIRSLGFNQFALHAQLFNVYAQGKPKATTASEKAVLWQADYRVSGKRLREAAHAISDQLYQHLTGVRGVFSTYLAYVLVQRPVGKPARYQLMVSDEDGFNPRPLLTSPEPIMSPAWSPDGLSIYYVSFEHHRAAIYKQRIVDGVRTRISDAPGINSAPAVSPDAQSLALVQSITGSPKIYLMNLETQAVRQLTRGYSIDTEPKWLPNGKALLFTSNRGGGPQIYRYDLADQKVSRVTFTGNYNAHASVLPNNQGFVMMHRENGFFDIAYYDFASAQMRFLTPPGSNESPSISPNSSMVVYASQMGGRRVLAMVSIDGRVRLLLPSQEGAVQEPAWSPFMPKGFVS